MVDVQVVMEVVVKEVGAGDAGGDRDDDYG
jgi:hypothetical protein